MSTDSSRQLLPEGLADLPPGPELAVALAGVDLGRLTSADLYTVAVLRARLVSHDQAELLSTMLTTAYAGYRDDEGQPPPEHCPLDEFSADQLAFTLHLSRIAAARQLDLAEQLIERLPAVFAALSAGRIDLVKARVFVEAVALLDDTTARAVVAKMLNKAESITVGQLRDQLRYRVLQADPGLAKRRQRHSVADRRVFVQLDDDGTATLAGVSLPPDRAAAAANRIERLARVAKADGDVRNLDQLKADAMLALLCGAPFVLHPPNDPHTADADEETRAAEAAIRANNPHPFPQPRRTGKTATGQDGQTTEPDANSGSGSGSGAGPGPGPGAGQGSGAGAGASSGAGADPGAGSGSGADAGSDSSSGAGLDPDPGARAGAGEPFNLPVRPGSRVDDPFEGLDRDPRTGLLLRPRLHFGNPNRTDPTGAQPTSPNSNDPNNAGVNGRESNMDTPSPVLSQEPDPDEPDHDEPEPDEPDPEDPDPGEGYQYSEASPDGDASFGSGFDPIGGAGMFDDPLPPRDKHGRVDLDRAPTPDHANLCVCGGIQPAPRRGVVNLLVPLTTLMCLTEDPGRIPGWGPVLADIARQVAFDQETNPAWVWSVTDQHGNLLHHGQTKRRPSASERAFVRARDGQCVGPGCRKQATLADIDHRQEPAADGGPAQRANLCVLCRHCHRLKHERGFVIHQVSSGSYIWEAPNGRLYMVLPNGDLIQTADDIEPPPPPGYVRAAFGIPDNEDW